jgi:hypothetical protein
MIRSLAGTVLVTLCIGAPLRAQTADDGVVVETLLTGLNNPCGVAIRPGDSPDEYEVFVAESWAGHVVRVSSDEPRTATPVISGFPLAAMGSEQLPAGPTGLLFLDRKHLVVGVGGSEQASIQMFELADPLQPITAEHSKQQVRLVSKQRSGNHVYAFSRTRANDTVSDDLLMTCPGNGGFGDVHKIPLVAGTLTEVQRFAAPRDGTKRDAPWAIAVGDGGYVVVGWVGSAEVPADSRLEFYNPTSRDRLLELTTDRYDITGLAYNPKSRNLYAADVAWMDSSKGGVFRIDEASERGAAHCIAVRIAEVPRPTALAFAPNGTLYVTALGKAVGDAPHGMLLRITGEL